MNSEENIGARVEKIIEHLKFNVFPILKISFTQKELSRQIDMAEGNITNAKKGDQRYTNAFVEKVNDKFGNIINEDWYISGEGEMLKTGSVEKVNHSENGFGVPYFEDIESTGGIIVGKANGGTEIPTFFIDYEHFNDCTAYIQHVGDSMYPKYCAGEIIAVKRVYNLDIILWGEAYLVVTNSNANDLRTVKLVFQHEDRSKVILRSSNPNFKGDTEISKKDIVSLFIIKGKITRNQL